MRSTRVKRVKKSKKTRRQKGGGIFSNLFRGVRQGKRTDIHRIILDAPNDGAALTTVKAHLATNPDDLNLKTGGNKTALTIATNRGFKDTSAYLRSMGGIDPTRKSLFGLPNVSVNTSVLNINKRYEATDANIQRLKAEEAKYPYIQEFLKEQKDILEGVEKDINTGEFDAETQAKLQALSDKIAIDESLNKELEAALPSTLFPKKGDIPQEELAGALKDMNSSTPVNWEEKYPTLSRFILGILKFVLPKQQSGGGNGNTEANANAQTINQYEYKALHRLKLMFPSLSDVLWTSVFCNIANQQGGTRKQRHMRQVGGDGGDALGQLIIFLLQAGPCGLVLAMYLTVIFVSVSIFAVVNASTIAYNVLMTGLRLVLLNDKKKILNNSYVFPKPSNSSIGPAVVTNPIAQVTQPRSTPTGWIKQTVNNPQDPDYGQVYYECPATEVTQWDPPTKPC